MRVASWIKSLSSWADNVAEDAKSILGATGAAFADRRLDHYPIETSGGIERGIGDAEILKRFGVATASWPKLSDEDLEATTAIAREALDEVKAQTEYQDAKAARLLTITTVLSALSGLLLGRFLDAYPVRSLTAADPGASMLIGLCYAFFALFAFSSLCGAVVTFHATRTRFRYPTATPAASTGAFPKSLIFWRGIIASTPEDWAGAFVDAGSGSSMRLGLRERHLAGLVQEAYLVAAKTADKLRMLQPAQKALAFSLKCLLIWLLLLGVTTLAVPRTAQTAPAGSLVDCRAALMPAGDAASGRLRCAMSPR